MTSSRVALRYARAIIDLSQEGDSTDVVYEDFLTLREAIRGSSDLRHLLDSPIVDDHVKEQVLAAIFRDKVGELVSRFVGLLARKGRARDIPAIIGAFERLRDVQRNEVPATIRTAVELRDDQRDTLVKHLSRISGRTVRPTWIIDRSLIGGFTATFDDTMVDASVRNQLERLRQSFVHGSLN